MLRISLVLASKAHGVTEWAARVTASALPVLIEASVTSLTARNVCGAAKPKYRPTKMRFRRITW